MSKMVAIEADKARNLKFSYNALIMLQDEFGIDISSGVNKMSLKDVRTFYFCGLLHEDSSLTLEQVGDILDEMIEAHGMEYVGEKLGEALQKAFGVTAAQVEKAKKQVAKQGK